MLEDEVLQIVSRHLHQVRRGANAEISALCPFHRGKDGGLERTPSFTMNLVKGVYHCFSCHASGNMMTFLRDVGVPRGTVAGQYQPLLDALRQNHPAPFDAIRPEGVVDQEPLPEWLLGHFESCPSALVDPEYFLDPDDQAFDPDVLQRHDIGFDEKHGRITFPIRDLTGQLVGISGRTVLGQTPRYKVYTKEYTAFGLGIRQPPQRGSILWNAHNVYNSVFFSTRSERVVVVEGFKACLWLIQAGIPNTVALLGSHLTEQHKWILERMGGKVYLMLDNDPPGQRALWGSFLENGQRWPGIAERLSKSLDVHIVRYDARQPSSLKIEEVQPAVDAAEDYYLQAAKRKMT